MKRKRTLSLLFVIVMVIMVLFTFTVPALAAPADTPPNGTEAITVTPVDAPADMTGIAIPASFSVIAILAYALAELLKKATSINTARLPLVLAVFGVIAGILIILFNPVARIPANATWQDVGWAIFQGAVYGLMSGLTAVGVNQIKKQGENLKLQSNEVETQGGAEPASGGQ